MKKKEFILPDRFLSIIERIQELKTGIEAETPEEFSLLACELVFFYKAELPALGW